MKTIATIPHPQMRISIFLWNNKYLVKFEAGPYEQTYKIDDSLVEDEASFAETITEGFISKVVDRFKEMNADFRGLF